MKNLPSYVTEVTDWPNIPKDMLPTFTQILNMPPMPGWPNTNTEPVLMRQNVNQQLADWCEKEFDHSGSFLIFNREFSDCLVRALKVHSQHQFLYILDTGGDNTNVTVYKRYSDFSDRCWATPEEQKKFIPVQTVNLHKDTWYNIQVNQYIRYNNIERPLVSIFVTDDQANLQYKTRLIDPDD